MLHEHIGKIMITKRGALETVEVVDKDHPIGHYSVNKRDITKDHVIWEEPKKEVKKESKKKSK